MRVTRRQIMQRNEGKKGERFVKKEDKCRRKREDGETGRRTEYGGEKARVAYFKDNSQRKKRGGLA